MEFTHLNQDQMLHLSAEIYQTRWWIHGVALFETCYIAENLQPAMSEEDLVEALASYYPINI
jgi:hypothetical protein